MDVRHWVTVTLVVTLISLLFLIAGYVSPLWIWVNQGNQYVGIGLWINVGCTNGTCLTASFSLNPDVYHAQVAFTVVKGLLSAALSGMVILSVFLCVYRAGVAKWKGMRSLNIVSTALSVLTLLTILAGIIVFCAYYWNVVGMSYLVSSTSFPWSPLMCFFAALILVSVAVLLRTKCLNNELINAIIPTSGDAKMELNPTTKSAGANRFFTPTPYNEDRRSSYYNSAYYDDNGKRALMGSDRHAYSSIDYYGYQSRIQPEQTVYTIQDRPEPYYREQTRYISDSSHPIEFRRAGDGDYIGDSRRITDGTHFAESRRLNEPQRLTEVSRYVSETDRYNSLPIPRALPDSDHIIYTGRQPYSSTTDIERLGYSGRRTYNTTIVTTNARDERDHSRFTTDGRMIAHANSYAQPSATDYGADFTTVHTDRSRVLAGAKVVLPPRVDTIANGDPTRSSVSHTPYIYRPYSQQKY